jgi:hypothetical protein
MMKRVVEGLLLGLLWWAEVLALDCILYPLWR